jgi:hypothetical protein
MRWNVLWYIPVALFCAATALFDAVQAWALGRDVISHWSWILLLSPSAYVWLAVTLSTVALPVQAACAIPCLFQRPAYHPYRYTTMVLAFTTIALAICWIVGWGSYPLNSDQNGYLHFRMIPFIPLPSYSLF